MFLLVALVLMTSSTALPDPFSSGAGELNEDVTEPWPALGEPLVPDDFGGRGPLVPEDDTREEYDTEHDKSAEEEEESTKNIAEDEESADAEEVEEKKEEEETHSDEEEERKEEEEKHSDEEEEEKKEEEEHSDEEEVEKKVEEEKGKTPFGSVFATSLFDVQRLTRYFKQLEDAVEKAFRVDDGGVTRNGTTYSDTTEEEVDSLGNKMIVHKSVVKSEDGGMNSSVVVEALSSSQDARTKRSNLEAKRIQ